MVSQWRALCSSIIVDSLHIIFDGVPIPEMEDTIMAMKTSYGGNIQELYVSIKPTEIPKDSEILPQLSRHGIFIATLPVHSLSDTIIFPGIEYPTLSRKTLDDWDPLYHDPDPKPVVRKPDAESLIQPRKPKSTKQHGSSSSLRPALMRLRARASALNADL